MTTKILCAIDDTDHAKPAIEYAAHLAKVNKAKLTVCTVNAIMGSIRSPKILALPDDAADKLVADAATIAQNHGVKDVDKAVLQARDVGAAIVHYADQGSFDHIVTGTGGKGRMARLALGSVATDVVNRAHCPVTVVR